MKTIISRGSNCIGVNCVKVATPNTRLIIDVGLPLIDPAQQSRTAKSFLQEGSFSINRSRYTTSSRFVPCGASRECAEFQIHRAHQHASFRKIC